MRLKIISVSVVMLNSSFFNRRSKLLTRVLPPWIEVEAHFLPTDRGGAAAVEASEGTELGVSENRGRARGGAARWV